MAKDTKEMTRKELQRELDKKTAELIMAQRNGNTAFSNGQRLGSSRRRTRLDKR